MIPMETLPTINLVKFCPEDTKSPGGISFVKRITPCYYILISYISFLLLSITGVAYAVVDVPKDTVSKDSAAAAVVLVETTATAAAAVPPAPTMNKGDVSWMLVCTALVLMMSVPALALFYGGVGWSS